MIRKGVFPYDYSDSENRLNETQLPPISVYFNKLTNESCRIEDYELAQKVWKTFKCFKKKFLKHLFLYLKVDVLLLGDIFENFRQVCTNIYNLDSSQYYTIPVISWDAMLKTTEIELEQLNQSRYCSIF